MMPHQVEANEIALSFQPELKSHVMNVQRVVFRILRDGGTPADVAKRAHEMFDSINEKLYQRMKEKADCKTGCAIAVASSCRFTSTNSIYSFGNSRRNSALKNSTHSSNASKP